MTSIVLTINSVDVSNDLIKFESWAKDVEGVARFALVLSNFQSKYSTDFSADQVVDLTVDTHTYFTGYIDRIVPLKELVDDVDYQTIQISGRNYGQDLQNKFYDYVYSGSKADWIVDHILSGSGCEVTFTSPNTAPKIYYDSKGAFVSDSLKEILELVDYSGYVDTSKVWQMFPHGYKNSGITLSSSAEAASNNIIKLIEHVEADSFELKNYIVVFGPKVEDGWTEGNASAWTGSTGNIISDFYNSATPETDEFLVMKGVGAIHCELNSGTKCGIVLQFPKYNHDYLDFSTLNSEDLSFIFKQVGTGIYAHPKIWLTDTDDKIIEYEVTGTSLTNPMANVTDSLTVSVGKNVEIQTVPGLFQASFQTWHYMAGATSFNWKIKAIKIWNDKDGSNVTDLYIDGLNIPSVQLTAVGDQTAGTPYKVRKQIISRQDIGSQIELDQYASSSALKRKDPIEFLRVYALGSAGYSGSEWVFQPGYACKVCIPDEAINDEYFRIGEVHSIFESNALNSGFDFIVELSMVPSGSRLDNQRWTYLTTGEIGPLRQMRDRLKGIEERSLPGRDWYPSLPRPLWELFGKIPPGGLEITPFGPNLLGNQSFELDYNFDGQPDCWTSNTAAGTPSFSRVGNAAHGIFCAKISATGSYGLFLSDYISVQPLTVYYASVYVTADNASGSVYCPTIYWYKEDQSASSSGSGYAIVYNGAPPTGWTIKSGSVTAPSDAYYCRFGINFNNNNGCTNAVYFDNAKMQVQYTDEFTGVTNPDDHSDDTQIWSGNAVDYAITTSWQEVIAGSIASTEAAAYPFAMVRMTIDTDTAATSKLMLRIEYSGSGIPWTTAVNHSEMLELTDSIKATAFIPLNLSAKYIRVQARGEANIHLVNLYVYVDQYKEHTHVPVDPTHVHVEA